MKQINMKIVHVLLVCVAVAGYLLWYYGIIKGHKQFEVSWIVSESADQPLQLGKDIPIINNMVSRPLPPWKCYRNQKCMIEQKGILTKMLTNGFLNNITTLSAVSWARHLPSENDVFNEQSIDDPLNAGNETMSTIEIVNKKGDYRVGELLTVLITIRDGRGRPTQHGGDQVRVWMVDKQQNASMATEVVDFGNGSYTAYMILPWAGIVTIKASLAYNLITQRAHYFVRNVALTTRYMGAGFASYFTTELTLCVPFPSVPGYEKVCNFTQENGGVPWFCGMPKDETLKCRHWMLNFDFEFTSPFIGTNSEKTWWRWMSKHGRIVNRQLLGSGINLLVNENKRRGKQTPLRMCEEVPIKESWDTKAPRGYFFNDMWIPMTCNLGILTKNEIRKCLKNTTILTMGDSNARLMFYEFTSATGCEMEAASKGKRWHYPLLCKNATMRTVVRWRSHALPFHMGSRDKAHRENQQSANEFIDDIPSEGRYFIVVHLFVHYSAHHDRVFLTHIKALRISIENLLRRNPNAKVVIRGPHTFDDYWVTPKGGDLVAPFYAEYIKREFNNIRDRVYYLDTMDMTVAVENKNMHPPGFVNKAMFNLILRHMCRK